MNLRIADLFNLDGKVAVVTGGSRGIGYMIASGLVANGVKVFITSRKAEACDAAALELGVLCTSVPADLSTAGGIETLRGAVAAEHDALHILVNNAGATWGAPIDEFPEIGFDKILDINVKAPFMVTQAFLPLLRAGGDHVDPARVVMVGSIDGLRASPMPTFSYSASKAGLHHMGRQMAHAMVDDHITVNCIAPGPFESNMMAFALNDEAMRAAIEAEVPRKRIGTPEDVVGTVIYLASRAGAYITGTVIPIDGGVSTK
jgi:NAD(P)-dependent dehydrogenase (short-subunit alcohol dehydrogenase family)